MNGYRDRLAAAFPASLRDDVLAALRWVPLVSYPTMSPVTSFSIDGSRTPAALRVFGEPVVIPSRIYVAEPAPEALPDGLPDVQRTILACLYTRHGNGFVRQRRLREILPSRQPWVVPFVVQLIGEYVIEIVTDVLRGLPELLDPASGSGEQYGRVLTDNPAFLTLTSHRVASYWNCYYRNRYADPRYYPGRVLVTALEDAARAWRQPPAQAVEGRLVGDPHAADRPRHAAEEPW